MVRRSDTATPGEPQGSFFCLFSHGPGPMLHFYDPICIIMQEHGVVVRWP
jgi:hypothetical protein